MSKAISYTELNEAVKDLYNQLSKESDIDLIALLHKSKKRDKDIDIFRILIKLILEQRGYKN